MTKLTDNIPFHLSNRVNILRSDFNWLSFFQGNWSHALLRIAIMFISSNISPIVAFGLRFLFFCMCVVRHWVYLSFLFSLKDIVSKSMCYEVSGFIDCMRFKSIFYKPNIHFPWFSECHACLYSRSVPLSYFKQHEALKLKEFFFSGAEFYSHELVEWKAVVLYGIVPLSPFTEGKKVVTWFIKVLREQMCLWDVVLDSR